MALILPLAVALAVLVACSALFSMSEAAFLTINKVRLRHLMQRGSAPANVVYHLLTEMDRLIATLLISNNVVNVLIAVLGTLLFIHLFGPERGPVWASVVVTVVLLVAAEITPKLFAVSHADRVALLLAFPLRAFVGLMRPLVWGFTRLSHALIRLLGGKRLPRSPLVTEEELKVMMELGREAGVLAEGELRMLNRIFEFSDSVVKEVMVLREDIAAVDLTAKPEDALDVLIEEGHARIPVYRESLDQIVGVIYARDLLMTVRHGSLFVLSDLIRPVSVVPEHKRIAELLSEFQRTRTQIAIVQDAKQRTSGLVTIEDLLEEIVGDIQEEAPPKKRSA
jgi:CBS domain containing-hemolysin-like protein